MFCLLNWRTESSELWLLYCTRICGLFLYLIAGFIGAHSQSSFQNVLWQIDITSVNSGSTVGLSNVYS